MSMSKEMKALLMGYQKIYEQEQKAAEAQAQPQTQQAVVVGGMKKPIPEPVPKQTKTEQPVVVGGMPKFVPEPVPKKPKIQQEETYLQDMAMLGFSQRHAAIHQELIRISEKEREKAEKKAKKQETKMVYPPPNIFDLGVSQRYVAIHQELIGISGKAKATPQNIVLGGGFIPPTKPERRRVISEVPFAEITVKAPKPEVTPKSKTIMGKTLTGKDLEKYTKISEEIIKEHRATYEAAIHPKGIMGGKPPSKTKSITQLIFEFDPAKAGAEFGAILFGLKGERKQKAVEFGTEFAKFTVGQAGKGLPMFEEPTKALAGVVATGESLAYFPAALAGKEIPYTPTFSGAAISEAGAAISGKGGGDTQKLYEEYGASYIQGSIVGDVLLAYAMGKGISKIRSTKIGSKVLDPILKPLDKAEEFITKKVYDPLKGKLTTIKEKIIKPKPQLTGFERTGFGSEGWGIKEYYGPPKESPFPKGVSFIKDETGEKFITQTARATSYPVKITGTERTVIGGGKPWIAILKNPPNPLGGGRLVLADPSLMSKTALPMIASLKTKIAPQLMASFASPTHLNFLATAFAGISLGAARATTKPSTLTRPVPSIIEIPEPDITYRPKFTPPQVYQKQKKERQIVVPRLPIIPIVTPDIKAVPDIGLVETTKQREPQIIIPKVVTIPKLVPAQRQREKEIAIPKVTQIPDVIFDPLQKTRQVPTLIPSVVQQQKTQQKQKQVQKQKQEQIQVIQFPKPPSSTTKKPPFVFDIPKLPKFPKFKSTGLFGGWRLKQHPVPSLEQFAEAALGTPQKKPKTKSKPKKKTQSRKRRKRKR